MSRFEDRDRETLILRYRRGDEEAFRSLLDEHLRSVRNRLIQIAPAWLARRCSVADVLQEACVVAYRRRGEFLGRDSRDFHAWLLGIARMNLRRAIQHHAGKGRRDIRREEGGSQSARVESLLEVDGSPSQFAMAAETRQSLDRSLSRLSADRRELLRLVLFQRLTLHEAAERMGRSYSAVKALHARALMDLTESFAQVRQPEGLP